MLILFENVDNILIKKIKRVLAVCQKELKQPKNIEVDVSFVSGDEIRELNKTNRKKDTVTDVLSFPAMNLKAGEIVTEKNPLATQMHKNFIFLGDIIICKEQAQRQAREYSNSYENEILKLVIHSFLHLLGYDHIKDDDYMVMLHKEQCLAKMLKIETNV